jgi:hypothetical protein
MRFHQDAFATALKKASVLVAIIPIAADHVGISPVPAKIGFGRIGHDAYAVGCENRSQNDAADEFAIIRLGIPVSHIGTPVPVLVPIVVVAAPAVTIIFVVLAPMLVAVLAPVSVAVVVALVAVLLPIAVVAALPVTVVVIAVMVALVAVLLPVAVVVPIAVVSTVPMTVSPP